MLQIFRISIISWFLRTDRKIVSEFSYSVGLNFGHCTIHFILPSLIRSWLVCEQSANSFTECGIPARVL